MNQFCMCWCGVGLHKSMLRGVIVTNTWIYNYIFTLSPSLLPWSFPLSISLPWNKSSCMAYPGSAEFHNLSWSIIFSNFARPWAQKADVTVKAIIPWLKKLLASQYQQNMPTHPNAMDFAGVASFSKHLHIHREISGIHTYIYRERKRKIYEM